MILFYVADIRYREGSKHSAIFSLNVDGKFLDIIEEYAVEKKNSELKVVGNGKALSHLSEEIITDNKEKGISVESQSPVISFKERRVSSVAHSVDSV